ncbi:hypothetical protein HYDPIDRAFT_189636 [Hydnomerulius pinastri MD-312]|uniref:Uncharacterized protein n=1 Tax=Hydnomerulius pinastri MD-312 TaxID=994086 RepID=A0A0C9V6V6_9AGAM|nr:hypothetical protein HYDPIDRAFT_189636 [Hydnomerulius pinastri MD-312]
MRAHIQSLWKTLLIYGHAPTSWSKASGLANEYVTFCMRIQFPQLRLCEDNWKTEVFATRHYPQWREKPLPAVEVKQEDTTDLAQDLIEKVVNGPQAPAVKRAHTTAISPSATTSPSSTRVSKKKKDVHNPALSVGRGASFSINAPDDADSNTALMDAPMIYGVMKHAPSALPSISFAPAAALGPPTNAPAPSNAIVPPPSSSSEEDVDMQPLTPGRGSGRRALNLVNPLSNLWGKAKGSVPSALPTSTTTNLSESESASTSAASSTADLATQMANTSVRDPADIVVPPTPKAKMAFMQNMCKSLNTAASISSKPMKGDAPASATATRNTAKGICRLEWLEANPGGSTLQFDSYWKKLPAEQKQPYNVKVEMVRAAKSSVTNTKGKGKRPKGADADTSNPPVDDAEDEAADVPA